MINLVNNRARKMRSGYTAKYTAKVCISVKSIEA